MSYSPMQNSPFAQIGPKLYALGYNPIPLMPGDKRPGMLIDGEWRLFKGWNQYCVTRPSQFALDQWVRWPNAGIGLACGQGVICIDIDLEDAVGPLLEILPLSNVQKKGKKGISLFYRGNTEVIRSKNYRTPKPHSVGLVDLLAEGKQTVLPPSIHPDTGEPYHWWTDLGLDDVTLDDLEELPDDIDDRIAEVLKGFGYAPGHDRSDAKHSTNNTHREAGDTFTGENIYRTVNSKALANLDAWVPQLQLYRCRPKPGGYEAVADWRESSTGRSLERRKRNLSIHREGITDFGDGSTYTSIDLVMAARNLAKPADALNWLIEHLPQEPLITLS